MKLLTSIYDMASKNHLFRHHRQRCVCEGDSGHVLSILTGTRTMVTTECLILALGSPPAVQEDVSDSAWVCV